MNPEPKFNIGDTVRCARTSSQYGDFDFVGQVYRRNLVDDEWEYWVTNAPPIVPNALDLHPLLVWESEMTLVEAAP